MPPVPYARLILCRRPPDRQLDALAVACAARAGRTLLFLHGEAVRRARAPLTADVKAIACRTSWDRRGGGALARGFAAGTLAALFQALGKVDELICIGRSGRLEQSLPAGPRRWLIDVAAAPTGMHERREVLEFALGCAAMALDARVLFRRAGYNHLIGEAARGWAQLTDFDMLELFVQGPMPAPPAGFDVKPVDAAAVASLRAGCDGVLTL